MSELKDFLKKAYSFYGASVPDDVDVFNRWRELFEKYGAEKMRAAFATYARESRFPPRPVDLFQILLSMKPKPKTQYFIGRNRTDAEIQSAKARILKLKDALQKRAAGGEK